MQNKRSLIASMDKENHRSGCMTSSQVNVLVNALAAASEDPALLSDLEGCGPVGQLERTFAQICGTRFALAVSSGTAAIHTALLACGVESGDEVIVTPYSWPQSVSPILFTGAVPVFADIDPVTLNVDPASVQNRLSPKTKAIVPVHLFGHAADMRRLQKIAADAGVSLIADAAHALGARINGRPLGTWGDAACFSLSRGKLVCGGEGGVLVTDNEGIFEEAVRLTQHPARMRRIKGPQHTLDGFGLNYRLHPLAAVLALADVQAMKSKLDYRRCVSHRFREGLGQSDLLSHPASTSEEACAFYGLPLIFNSMEGRETLTAAAQSAGIPLRCGPVKVPLHLRLSSPDHPSHRNGSCPAAELHCNQKELWALSAVDIDAISPDEAFTMGAKLRKLVASLNRGEKSACFEI